LQDGIFGEQLKLEITAIRQQWLISNNAHKFKTIAKVFLQYQTHLQYVRNVEENEITKKLQTHSICDA